MDLLKLLYRSLSSAFVILATAWLVSDARAAVRVSEGDVRLVGGVGPYEGTVLIRHNAQWGAICDSYWDLRDGKVVCKQLGYPGVESVAKRSRYGSGRGLIWLSRMRCRGDEYRLSHCWNDGWAYHNCYGGYRSAGVKCKKKPPSTVADTSTTNQPTTPITVTTTALATTMAQPFGGTTPKLSETGGNKSAISEIDVYNITELTGQLAADAPIAVNKTAKKRDRPKKIEIRLAGGRFKEEGRVEARINDEEEWGVICGDDWQMLEAMVVCKELGMQYAKLPTKTNYYGGQDMDKVFRSVKCAGQEDSLYDCDITMTGDEEPCSKPISVAGVICTTELPDLIPNVTVLQKSAYVQDQHLYYLQCAMEEKCLAQSAYELRKTNKWINAVRRLFRFSSVVHNRGRADFRPHEPKESWEWHDCHMHYHSMSVFTHYDLVDEHGNRVAEGHKASFCLEDSDCDIGIEPRYRCIGFADQGISPGCSDNYLAAIDCQWIDVTDLKPGEYIFRLVVNPTFYVAEYRYDNNAVSCDFAFTGVSVKVTNCTLDPTVITYKNP